ncbi:hypothetical protein M011DRAFT_474989 [Sporormia fimetaria CBS 119925]|uniref:Uncharacterized protein n=1 Tax=Sporormia fimetaria CBS 119925 TaxID=1340428 RepID=A0A6A6VHN3_9PLEO|nr:hypothetical protein M011DRAFT_474989 [Sporormia fimetaria CBS 119925]
MKFTAVIAAAIMAATAYGAAVPEPVAAPVAAPEAHCWWRGMPCSKARRGLEAREALHIVERDAEANPEAWSRKYECTK